MLTHKVGFFISPETGHHVDEDELVTAINSITETISHEMLKKFLTLPSSQQKSFVLIKSSQLLLANILCQAASTEEELRELLSTQGEELKELTLDCAISGYGKKFQLKKH